MTRATGDYRSGTVVHRQMVPATRDGGSPVDMTARSDTPEGLRLLAAVPAGGPVGTVPATRELDGLPVTVVFVTAASEPAARKRVRTECAELEARLADLDPRVVLPLLDHGVAGDRPYLVLPRPGPALVDALGQRGPLPLAEVAGAARALVAGLRLLATRDIVGPPPALYRTAGGGVVLGTPLPPVVLELAGSYEHEPPEVLQGRGWTPAGQVYACASVLWTLLAGRPPYDATDQGRLDRLLGAEPAGLRRDGLPEIIGVTLTAALSATPELRPGDLGLLADVVTADRQNTRPPTHPVPSATPGTVVRRLGSYQLDREIGRGAMGEVWAGRRVEGGDPVAVKLLRRELAENPDMVRRFLLERSTLVRLDHRNLVRIHDLVAEGGVLGLVMDLVDGEDLRRHAARGRLSTQEVANLLGQAAEALAAVHAAGVVHRDLKPENILVTQRDGRLTALLTDFGIARPADGRATQLVCTPAYVAPELVAGEPPKPAADIYALGITAYELLAGRRPFDAPTTAALLQAHGTQPVARPDGMDDRVWELVSACLDKRPERRPSATRVAAGWAALAQAGVLHGVARPAAPPSTVDSSGTGDGELLETSSALNPAPYQPAEQDATRRRRWPWVVTSAGVLAVGATVGVILALSNTQPPGQQSTTSSWLYQVAGTVSISGNGAATVRWSEQATSLPGLQAFQIVRINRTTGHADLIGDPMPSSTTSFTVTGLRPDQGACFKVLAYGVTAPPPNPPPPPACVTPPGDR